MITPTFLGAGHEREVMGARRSIGLKKTSFEHRVLNILIPFLYVIPFIPFIPFTPFIPFIPFSAFIHPFSHSFMHARTNAFIHLIPSVPENIKTTRSARVVEHKQSDNNKFQKCTDSPH